MIPIDILNHVTDKQVIRNSAAVRIQVAFYASLEAVVLNPPTRPGAELDLTNAEMQELVLAPRIEIGHIVSDDEVTQLADYLLKAYLGFVDAYRTARFPRPCQAGILAMRRFSLLF